ncbi:SMR family transporter [Desertibacillus haloalkaliphilus]|uniref:SMR family transporter n=1 Tax=Desertibacillus haloalkaliphilus TaxID=1328930 RepID=UPI001C26349C|nr:SMR family transporter [Desertibacillus haloalkaliphilus]MBU8905915.1 EamA family transporter [Desertibacillus haloalkaliphilus]
MNNLVVILLSVLLGSIGQVVLKIGANKLDSFTLSFETLVADLLRMARTPEIVIGLVLFGTSFLLWIKVLTKADLSYAYPLVSLGYINVVILSYFLFGESFTVMKVLGITLIISGVIVLNL